MARKANRKNRRKCVFDALTVAAALIFALGMTMAQVEASHVARAHPAVPQIKWQREIETGRLALDLQAGRMLARLRLVTRGLE